MVLGLPNMDGNQALVPGYMRGRSFFNCPAIKKEMVAMSDGWWKMQMNIKGLDFKSLILKGIRK